MKIALFIERFDHIRKNEFYVNSFCKKISHTYEVDFFELQNIQNKNFDSYDLIISVFRLRIFTENCEKFSKILKGKRIHVLDHDPWLQFQDNSPCLGYYKKIIDSGVNATFNVSSDYWSNRVNNNLHMSCISHVWGPTIPEDRKSRAMTPWDSRKNLLGFSGTDYSWRVKNHSALKELFPEFKWQQKVSYNKFEDYMFDLKIWLQSEKDSCIEKGKSISPNSLWPKALEVLSYGVFMIKDYQEESKFYEIEKLPTAFLFQEYEEICDILEKIRLMNKKEKIDRVMTTLEIISNGDYMQKAVDKIISYK